MIPPDYRISLEFLKTWHPEGPWSLGAIDPDDHNGLAWMTSSEEAAVEAFLVEQGALRRNCYYQPNLCRPDLGDRRASKEHVVLAVAIHADLDPPDVAELAELHAWQADAAARLESHDYWVSVDLPPPSVVVFSGTGFQTLWRLSEPAVLWKQDDRGGWCQDLAAIAAIEGRCAAVLRRIDPAHSGTHNVDRLLRLPGTLNWPNAQKRRKGRSDPELAIATMNPGLHPLAAFPCELVPHRLLDPIAVSPGQRVPVDRLRAMLPEWLLASVIDGAPPGADRSKLGFSTICALLRSGFNDEVIASIALDPTYKISEHYRDQADPERAVVRALAAAHAEVDPQLEELAGFRASIARWSAMADARAATAPPGESEPAADGPGTPSTAPSDVELAAALKSAQKRLGARRDPDSLRDAELLRRVRSGEFLTDGSDLEERQHALSLAAVAIARAAPPGTRPVQIERQLLTSAGLLAPDVPEVVALAVSVASSMPPMFAAQTGSRASAPSLVQEPALDEFLLETHGPRQGQPMASAQHNFEVALQRLGISFRLDVFAQRKYLAWRVAESEPDSASYIAANEENRGKTWELVDEDIMKKIPTVIEKQFGYYPPKDKFRDYCDVIAYDNRYHPVRDYLDALPPWDQTSRIDTWLIRLAGAKDTPYVRAVSRIFLVAAVHRICSPGCKFDEMIVLESQIQGTEKTTFVRTLCPQPEWFGPRLPFNGDVRTRMEATAGKWIVEAGELAGMDRRDHRELKDYLSWQEDEARMAYAREPRRVPRQFVVIGTTNDIRYLRDQTGNRRYWPIAIVRCDTAGLRAELDQLWAEAAVAETAGESIRLAEELWAEAATEQEQRRILDPFEVILAPKLGDLEGQLLVEDAWRLCGFADKNPSPVEMQRISHAMARLGWQHSRRRKDTIRRYCYASPGAKEHQWIQVAAGGGGWRCVVQGEPAAPPERSVPPPN